MGGDATEELARTCDAMKALVIELAKQAHALRLPELLRLEGALVDGPSPATCRGPPRPRRGTCYLSKVIGTSLIMVGCPLIL